MPLIKDEIYRVIKGQFCSHCGIEVEIRHETNFIRFSGSLLLIVLPIIYFYYSSNGGLNNNFFQLLSFLSAGLGGGLIFKKTLVRTFRERNT